MALLFLSGVVRRGFCNYLMVKSVGKAVRTTCRAEELGVMGQLYPGYFSDQIFICIGMEKLFIFPKFVAR